MMVLTALLRYREQLAAVPPQGSSRVAKAKNKNRHQLAGALFLDSDYFADVSYEQENVHEDYVRRPRV
jgi:hypothetical protein